MYRLLVALATCGLLTSTALAQFPAAALPKLTPEEEKALAPFMTKDFKLTSPLEVRNELKGFGTYFGTTWHIEPDGSWIITRILQNNTYVIGKGQISKKQIYDLAKALLVFDPLSLPSAGEQPLVNPHVITVMFGPKVSFLTFGVDQKLPPVSVNNFKVNLNPLSAYVAGGGGVAIVKVVPPPDPLSRYSGIEWAVRGLIQPNLGVVLNLPERLKQMGHP